MSRMQFFFLVLPLTVLSVAITEEGNQEIVSENMRKKLDQELLQHNSVRNVRESYTPNFKVRALLIDCPNPSCNVGYSNSSSSRDQQTVVRNKNDNDSDASSVMTNCIQKMLLTIKIRNEGRSSHMGSKSQYLVVDHVVDPATNKKMRLLNPFVVRFRQEPILQIYGLKLEKLVNAEAKEVVHNTENSRNYRGCNLGRKNPTCGLITTTSGSKVVPYSTGFCCSCPNNNDEMMMMGQRPRRDFLPDDDRIIGHYNPDTKLKHYGFIDGHAAPLRSYDGEVVYGGEWSKSTDRSVNYQQLTEDERNGKYGNGGGTALRDSGSIIHRRGGQNCNQDIDPELLQSTHCLSFSHLWYAVYVLEKPQIYHKIRAQMFQKHEDCHGTTHWKDVTRGQTLISGTVHPLISTDDGSIIVKYQSDEIDDCKFALNYKTHKLLMPERKMTNPDEFMVVPKNMVSTDGKTCNTAGVGYEAFYKQTKRCSQPKGACLFNQPQHFFDQDKKAEKSGRKGKYFLKYYGDLPDEDPIGRNCSGQERDIKLLFTREHNSVLNLEIKADYITILQPDAFATLTEVYIDASSPLKTSLVVKVTNAALTYGVFYVRLGSCPLEVPASFNNIASKSALIGPQHQHIFNLDIECPLPKTSFTCFVFVHDTNQQLIAKRKVRFEKSDRCICIWHCECACYVADGGLKCTALSLKSYRETGFQGGLPVASRLIEPSNLDDLLVSFFHTFIIFAIILLIMGLIKALLGLCSREIGMWGLYTILGIESSESDEDICDNKDCEFRKDRGDNISLAAQFCLNVIFFFIYPLALINTAVKRMCFASYTQERPNCVDDEELVECECEDILNRDFDCDDPERCRLRATNTLGEPKKTSVSQETLPTGSRSTISNVSGETKSQVSTRSSIKSDVSNVSDGNNK